MKDDTDDEIITKLMLNKAGIIGPVKITQGTREPGCSTHSEVCLAWSRAKHSASTVNTALSAGSPVHNRP